ncbi:DUF3014 domain-containing protein [Rheinheimera sp. 4Y26]|uniref:DUF3014 domain-containing protein n=1 Tax=Rheinheimera sp. 4Y26 TaxID=2977811 RepID=UPI0021B0AE62|nr:DUF3014 domain-containing protein [Rheinheimera sp. 4Y26]MCT6700116.1 DUF3014 domain-containing protein [Rheinheimera sp. 4Y26]
MSEQKTGQQPKNNNWLAPVVLLAIIAASAWYLLKPEPEPAPKPVTAVAPPVAETAPAPVKEPEDVLSATEEPVDEISAQAADAGVDGQTLPAEQEVVPLPSLPALDESDALVQQELLKLNWKPGLAALFVNEEMIRRFVVQVDNIAQGQLVPQQGIFKGLKQDFKVVKNGAQYQLDSANYARYNLYLDLLESAPKEQVVTLFNQLYPLMQSAYQELGYPEQQFRDRVQQAIKVLLAAPEVADSPMLVLDSVQYSFADAELEQLGLAAKQMIRLGQKNQQRLKLLLAAYQPLLAKR